VAFVVYEMEAVGVGGALEACTMHPYCCAACQAKHKLIEPFKLSEGVLSSDGWVCETCGKPIPPEVPTSVGGRGPAIALAHTNPANVRHAKMIWLTPWPTCESLARLCIESAETEPSHKRLTIRESLFPEVPTAAHPQRHVISIGLLEREDLAAIRDAISAYLS
jgi:hypothetical protein